jgi:hypothetical protein
MDRDRGIWVSAADHVGCLLGIEMALIKRGSPASDWHQGDVDVRHLVKDKVRTCVPGIPAPARALDEIAECRSAMRTARESPPVVVCSQDAYLQVAKLHEVTRLDLAELHTAGGDRPEQAARTCWRDENRGGRDESERWQVGVVSVEVGDQDKIRPRSLRWRNRTADPTKMAEASGQDGVEQDGRIAVPPCAGAVAPPRECARHGAACFSSHSGSVIGQDHHHRCRSSPWLHQAYRRQGAGSDRCNLQVTTSADT